EKRGVSRNRDHRHKAGDDGRGYETCRSPTVMTRLVPATRPEKGERGEASPLVRAASCKAESPPEGRAFSMSCRQATSAPWQCLNFLPDPQGQGSLRLTRPQVAGSFGSRWAPVDGLMEVAAKPWAPPWPKAAPCGMSN